MTTPKRCRAHRSDGEPCKRPPIRGGTVCSSHGGRAPAVRAAADRRLAERAAEVQAVKAVETLTSTRAPMTIRDVYRELLDVSGLVVAWKDVLRDRVDVLSEYTASTVLGGEQIRGEVLLFERAMDRALKVLEAVARLDLDTRLTSLTERDGELLTGVVRLAMATAELTPEQTARFDAAMAEGLRKLSESGAGR